MQKTRPIRCQAFWAKRWWLVNPLGTDTPTVLVPTHAAFAALQANDSPLTAVFSDHVLSARRPRSKVPVGAEVKTVQGDTLVVNASQRTTDLQGRSSQTTATDVFARSA